jgi:hypothetical protein
MVATIAIIFAVMIAVAHYLSDRLCVLCKKIWVPLISSVAGIAIVYVFVNLYPEFYSAASFVSPFIFTSVFLGFSIFYLIDKEIYQKIKHEEAPKNIELAHGYGLTIYYFVVGIALVRLLSISLKEGILFFIPVFIYAGMSTLASYGIHGMHSPPYKILTPLHEIQALGVILGTLVALFFSIPEFFLLYLTGLIVGILTYIVIRDMLPKGRRGKPLYFVLGALSYLALIIILWYV